MLANYLKIAIRILSKNKVYVSINLLSLGFALACCVLSYLHYDYRESFDQNFPGTGHIYRLNSQRIQHGDVKPWAVTPLPLAELLVQQHAKASRFARLYREETVVKRGEDVFSEKIHYADKAFFDFFPFPLQSGNYASFGQRNTVILSEAFASKYFGQSAAVGKEITIINSLGKEEVFTVGAVLQKTPANSSFQVDIVAPFEQFVQAGPINSNDWASSEMISTFVEVKNPRDIPALEGQLKTYVAKHNQVRDDWQVAGFYFQPFRDIAFSSDIDRDGFVYGSPLNANPRGVIVIVPLIMSLFILLITCFNFTNISVAFASSRLKEIGIRKAMGGFRKQLVQQFLTENLILCLLASVLSLFFVYSLLPTFNQLSGLNLQLDFQNDLGLWGFVLLLPIVTALIAGMYPALYISSFEPIAVLKGKTTIGSSSRFTRLLLVFQFSISCLALIVGIQLTQNASYQEQVNFGYDIDRVIVTEVNTPQEFAAFSNAVQQNPAIERVAGTTHTIGDGSYEAVATLGKQAIKAQVAHIGGENFLKTMGIRLLQGRHFHEGQGLDSAHSVLVNQTLAKSLNLREPVGQQIQVDSAYFTIVGVVEDYKEFGLHGLVPPCVLRLAKADEFKYVVVRGKPTDLAAIHPYLRSTWQKVVPHVPYRGFLQMDMIEKEIYLNEGFQSVAFFLAVVTMLLSASGLFALVSLNILRRNKEIGIRKVMGASIMQIIMLINKDFIRMMLLAFIIGSSLGYLLVTQLFFQFIYVYHPSIGADAFVLTFVTILLTGSLTVGFKVLQAANANPVKALRTE
jgi:putative ABC transport system permease protein